MTNHTGTTAQRREATRLDTTRTIHLPAPPQDVFPLLCPVREYDWIEPWNCELLHSLSGVAELGCVFRATLRDCGEETWLCVRYEPSKTIEYVRFALIGLISHLTITLAPDGAGGSSMLWHTQSTATTDAGREHLAGSCHARYQKEMAALEHMLRHYLKTGTMLRGLGQLPTLSEAGTQD